MRSEQVEWTLGVVHLNPEGREQNKKHRPVVKLPKTLANDVFRGWLVTHRGRHVKSIKTAWRAAAIASWSRGGLSSLLVEAHDGPLDAATGFPAGRSPSSLAIGSWPPRGFTPNTTRSTSMRLAQHWTHFCRPCLPEPCQWHQGITRKSKKYQREAAVAQW